MYMLASYMQLLAVGYWDVGQGTNGLANVTQKEPICNTLISQSGIASTIRVIPYTLLLVVFVLIVLAGQSQSWLRMKMPAAWRDLLDAWALHSPGQLHRELTERIQGKFEKVDTGADWPTVDAFRLGPRVVTRDNMKRFDTASEPHVQCCLRHLFTKLA
jgi:hypothetical protein